jgi:hypothetical protein
MYPQRGFFRAIRTTKAVMAAAAAAAAWSRTCSMAAQTATGEP